MSTHSLFAPSAASRWMACPGSMAFSENHEQGESNAYADDGTASHELAAMALRKKQSALHFMDTEIVINGKTYTFDYERCERIQSYLDDIRRRAATGYLLVEQHVDLSAYLGSDQGGTADAVIAAPDQRLGIVEDLKDGSGEQVYASYIVQPATDTTPEVREPNPQLALYALGMLPSFELFGEIDEVLLVIFQPKLDHIDEFRISVVRSRLLGQKAALAVELSTAAMAAGESSLVTAGHLNPGKKQCRWCRAKARCPALLKSVQDETYSDFEDMEATPPAVPITDRKKLARAYAMIPLIEQWVDAVTAEVQKAVTDGEEIIGPDGKPYKYVEGKEGARKWKDEAAAESALAGQLSPEQMYTPRKVITAPAAAKLLKKKKTEAMWNDVFEPLIARPRGKPILTIGSDSRPVYSGALTSDDYEDEISQ